MEDYGRDVSLGKGEKRGESRRPTRRPRKKWGEGAQKTQVVGEKAPIFKLLVPECAWVGERNTTSASRAAEGRVGVHTRGKPGLYVKGEMSSYIKTEA